MDIEKIKRLNLKPGDYVIAKIKGEQSPDVHIRISKRLRHFFEKDIEERGVKVLVLDDSMEIIRLKVKQIVESK